MSENSSYDDRRDRTRFQLNLPAQMNGNGYHNIEMIDISSSGMQIKTDEFDIFQGEGYIQNRLDQLRICFIARLAWAEPQEGGGFLTGWEFEMVESEEEKED